MASTTTPSTSNSTSISTSTSASEQSARSGDEEAQSYPTKPPSGYPLLAACMGQMPQMAMFRRFSAMNAQDLLDRQAEIVGMEKELHELQHRDANKTGRPREYTQNWELLRHSARDGNSEQWDLVKKLRMKLKEYNEALALQITIVSADAPSIHDVRWLQRFLLSDDMGEPLNGKDRHVWGGCYNEPPIDHAPDLVSLLPQRNEDPFSKWMSEHVIRRLLKLDKLRSPSKLRGVAGFEYDQVLRWTFAFSTAVASALPVASIAVLYSVRSQKVRLILIAAFNVALAFAISLLASPRIVDTFTASFAFSAINVIWFSSSNDTDGT